MPSVPRGYSPLHAFARFDTLPAALTTLSVGGDGGPRRARVGAGRSRGAAGTLARRAAAGLPRRRVRRRLLHHRQAGRVVRVLEAR